MKKSSTIVLSFLLSLTILFIMPAVSVDAETGSVTFGVLSDTHIGRLHNLQLTEEKRFSKALTFLSGENAEAIFVAGDLTNNGLTLQYAGYADIIKKANIKIPVYECMGNHDRKGSLADFKKYTDEKDDPTNASGNSHHVINGYHFIMLSPDDEESNASFSDSIPWLKEQLAIAASDSGNKPIFVFSHQQVKDTVVDSNVWYAKDLDKEVFDNYPQVVAFGGHSHVSNSHPMSIWQGNFTVVNTATLSYYVPERYTGFEVTEYEKDNKFNVAQGLLVSVNGAEVTIKTYDFITHSYLEEQIWTFDTSKQVKGNPSTFPYDTDRRAAKSQAPYFDSTAGITVSNLGEEDVHFTFDQAKIRPTDAGDVDWYYKVSISTDGKIVSAKNIFSDFFLVPRSKTLSSTFSGLVADKEYTISVVPVNAFGKEGLPITRKFKNAKNGDSEAETQETDTDDKTIHLKGTTINKLQAGKKSFVVKWKKQSEKTDVGRITGYQIRYSTKKNFSGKKIKTVKGYKNTSQKIAKLKSKTKYYVQLRTYMKVDNKTYYSSWSKTKSVKTK